MPRPRTVPLARTYPSAASPWALLAPNHFSAVVIAGFWLVVPR